MDVPVLCLEFEGVIADTAAARATALAAALEPEGVTPSAALLAAARGHAVEDAVRRARRAAGLAEDETAVELGRLRAERAFAARIGKGIALHPGARLTLERLASHCRLALVTRASRREVEFLLALAGLEAAFRPVITSDDVRPAKPDRGAWVAALHRVGQLFPAQRILAVAVEDHVEGIRGARAAGLGCIAVGPMPAHEAVEADAWIDGLADLTPERVRALTAAASGDAR